MWTSWFNIHEKFNNHILKYIYKGVEHQIKFDHGNYMMSELNEEFQNHFEVKKPPIELDVHQATSRFVIKLDTGYAIDFTGYELYKILGFEEKIYDQPKQKGKFIADISKGIDELFIHCDRVRSLHNEGTNDILHVHTHSNPPGSIIKITEINPVFEDVNTNHPIERIRMHITNQDNEIIDLDKQRMRYTLILDE
ncbi:hypothetical protein AVEN_32698-1 [Araneus ventricosus]|uniref:Uncharacterized protein n=1 Tax=Araneus ventricosus TaxID=182803 RepID=A0A4Y2NDS8_ARAVE|nr:hypothetical protein AVEN_32698-1 [Araneus ventricosus]